MTFAGIITKNRAKDVDTIRRITKIVWGVTLPLVVVGSILPSSILGRLHYGALAANDKLVHLSAYTMLGFLAVINLSRLDAGLRAALFTLAMGTALEYIQLRIPGRSCEVGDMVANATGVLLGVTLAGACRACYRRMAAESVQ